MHTGAKELDRVRELELNSFASCWGVSFGAGVVGVTGTGEDDDDDDEEEDFAGFIRGAAVSGVRGVNTQEAEIFGVAQGDDIGIAKMP